MTRRRLFTRRPLNLQQYIHRATVGLPKTERLDVAAELRTHLVDRINALRAEGHPTEEAEYLAVQAMGDPAPTNRGLLGHAFTHRAGWAVLTAVLLGGGSWAGYGYAEREWMPPREGIQFSGDLTLDDLKALNADQDAPKGTYQTATLTYPRATKTIYYALVTPGGTLDLQQKDVAAEQNEILRMNQVQRLPGSARYQERWLLTELRSDSVCPGRWELYANNRVIPNRFLPVWSVSIPNVNDVQNCSGVRRQYVNQTVQSIRPGTYTGKDVSNIPLAPVERKVELIPPYSSTISGIHRPLTLNHWTVLRDLVLNPRTAANGRPDLMGKVTGMFIAILPSDQPARDGSDSYSADDQGRIYNLKYGGKELPELPKLNVQQGHYVAK